MDKKITGIVSYITIIGWIIAYCVGDKNGAKVHLNQALVLAIAGLVGSAIGFIPIIGWIVAPIIGLVVLLFAILGIVYAAQDQDKELPIIGQIKLLK